MGKLIEPVVAPLGFDWQIGIGIISSFAAREVIVSTLSIVYGLGEEGADEEVGLYDTLREAKRIDGSPVFTSATCISLLVFYVLAMQCLPTQAITRRETNGWKWAIFQLVYMSVLAYSAAFVAYQGSDGITSSGQSSWCLGAEFHPPRMSTPSASDYAEKGPYFSEVIP